MGWGGGAESRWSLAAVEASRREIKRDSSYDAL